MLGKIHTAKPRSINNKATINCAGDKYTIEQMPNGEITVKQRVAGVNKTIAKGQIKATLRKIAEIAADFQYDENWNTRQFGKKINYSHKYYPIMKQKLFMRLAAAAAVLLLSAATATAHDFEVDGIYYNKNSDGTSVSVTFKGSSYYDYSYEYSGAVTIPASVTYSGKTYSVTEIGEHAFDGCSGLTSVSIGNSVTTIGEYAFRECSGLKKVEISDLEAWCKISFSNVP